MKASERALLAALCVAGAALGSFAVLLIKPQGAGGDPQAVIEVPPPVAQASPPPVTLTPRSDRLMEPPADDQSFRTATAPPDGMPDQPAVQEEPGAGENPDSWTVETRTETLPPLTVPQQPGARQERLPWQSGPGATPAVPKVTLAERLKTISPAAKQRLADKFRAAKVDGSPAEIGLVAIKDQKVLELFVRQPGGQWTFVHRYPVLAASGVSGPKLKQGDKQVPEGVYGISFLNPNSRYHVSLRVNYPNGFDRQMADKDGRKDLGGDIMIHGKAASIGCLAIGDAAAEELFVLAAETGLPKIKLIIAPSDFRRDGIPAIEPGKPQWLPQLYTEIASAMSEFKAPPASVGLLSIFGI